MSIPLTNVLINLLLVQCDTEMKFLPNSASELSSAASRLGLVSSSSLSSTTRIEFEAGSGSSELSLPSAVSKMWFGFLGGLVWLEVWSSESKSSESSLSTVACLCLLFPGPFADAWFGATGAVAAAFEDTVAAIFFFW